MFLRRALLCGGPCSSAARHGQNSTYAFLRGERISDEARFAALSFLAQCTSARVDRGGIREFARSAIERNVIERSVLEAPRASVRHLDVAPSIPSHMLIILMSSHLGVAQSS